MLYIYGYVRRSANEKIKANYSVDSQKRLISELASSKNEIIQEWFIDEGYSGTHLKRPSIQRMLKQIYSISKEDPKAEFHVYIWMASRLSRNRAYTRSLRLVFDKYNVEVFSCQGFDWVSIKTELQNPDAALLPAYVNVNDETEVARDKYRTLQGLITSAKAGNYTIGGSIPPVGWKFVDNPNGKGRRIELDPDYVEVMLYICKAIHDNKRTIESLSNELNSKKVCGKKWGFMKVYRIVTNPLLYGKFVTSYVEIENHSPAYISKEYFDEIQDVIHGRRKETVHSYLFKKLVVCNHCKILCNEYPTIHYPRSMITKMREKRWKYRKIYRYYHCPKCNKRINETRLLELTLFDIQNQINNDLDYNTIKKIDKKISRLTKRAEFLNEEYDEGYIDDEYYRRESRDAIKRKKDLLELKKKLYKKELKKFSDFDQCTKKDMIKKTFKKLVVDLENKKLIEKVHSDNKK